MSSVPSPQPQTPPRRRWLRRLLVLLLILVSLPAGYYFYGRWSFEAELAKAVAETDALDARWRMEDIEADRKAYGDDENSALHVIKVIRMIGRPAQTPGQHKKYSELFGDLPSAAQMNVQQLAIIREAFEKSPEALAEARKLKDMPNGRFAVTYFADGLNKVDADQHGSRLVWDLLQHDAMLRAQNGLPDEAMESCTALLNATRSLGDEPFIISLLIRLSGDVVVVIALERTLAQGFPSAKHLEEMQGRLSRERKDLQAHWISAVRGTRADNHRLFLALYRGKTTISAWSGRKGPPPGWWEQFQDESQLQRSIKDYPNHLRYMNKVVAAVHGPPEQQVTQIRELAAMLDQDRNLWALLAPSPTMPMNAYFRTQTRLATAEAGLACERFRQTHQRWPQSLAELVTAKLIDAVPTDPIDGRPLRLVRLKDGVVVDSAGLDKQDNGGNIQRDRPDGLGVDLGFRLWDEKRRRQPPRPAAAIE